MSRISRIEKSRTVEELVGLKGLRLTESMVEHIYRLQKVEYVIEDICDHLTDTQDDRILYYEDNQDILRAEIRKAAWNYVFGTNHTESNVPYCEQIRRIISDIPVAPVCENLSVKQTV